MIKGIDKTGAFIAVLVAAVIVGGLFGYLRLKDAAPTARSGEQPVVTFSCDDEKSLWAIFGEDSVHISLSEGKDMDLPKATSSTGTRYANVDGSFVFTSDGKTASFDKDGEPSYVNCKEKPVGK